MLRQLQVMLSLGELQTQRLVRRVLMMLLTLMLLTLMLLV